MIVGFNFDKINVERKSIPKGKVEIKNNISISNVSEEELVIKSEQKAMKFGFEYTVDYEPKMGNIELKGHLVYMADSKKVNDMLSAWKKTKKIGDEKIAMQVLTTILTKCNIKALVLAQELGLPQPIPLPIKIDVKADPKNYIG